MTAHSDDDIDSLLGDTDAPAPAAPKKRGRPTREMMAARETALLDQDDDDAAPSGYAKNLWTPAELGKWFRMEAVTVSKRLADLEPKAWRPNNRGRPTPLYDRVDAAAYLVKPRIDLVAYLKTLNSNNIPPHINKTFWDAMNAREKWEYNAAHTWRDEDVLEVLGATAIAIREVSLLWVDQLPDKVSLSEKNHNALRAAVSDLLQDVKKRLVDLPKQRRTLSKIATIDDHLEGGVNVDPEDFLIGDYDDGGVI